MKLLKGIYPITAVYLMVALILLVFSELAKADYAYLAVDTNKYESNDIWRQTSTGYDLHEEAKTSGYTIGYVWEHTGYNIRAAYHSFGQVSRTALWGDPDNHACHTCSSTSIGYQIAEAQGLSFAIQPKAKYNDLTVYATAGAIFYDTTWQLYQFHAQPKHSQDRSFHGTATAHDSGVTWLAGVGLTFQNIVVEYEYTPVNAEGKGNKLGGGGAYDGIKSLRVGFKINF